MTRSSLSRSTDSDRFRSARSARSCRSWAVADVICLRVAEEDAAAAAATRAADGAVGRPLLVLMLRPLLPLPALPPLLLPRASLAPRGFEMDRRPYPPEDGRGDAATRRDRETDPPIEAAAWGKSDGPVVVPKVWESLAE